jgi:hypothetical protein
MKINDAAIYSLCALILGGAVCCNSAGTEPATPKQDAGAASAPRQEARPAAAASPSRPVFPSLPRHRVTSAKWKGGAALLGVGLGVDGRLIAVRFRMGTQDARRLQQGNIYVIDETTKNKYCEVPVMPKVGPLISRPKQAEQVGYAMLVNAPVPLKAGAVVTVVLGNYKQEHVLLQ